MRNEAMKKVLGAICDYTKVGIVVASPYVISKASKKIGEYVLDKITAYEIKDYDDVVGVILDSNMFGSEKKEALGLLQKGKDKAYYRTVSKVVKSSMFGSTKIDMIRDINVREEEES